jgi:hypothetical protein
MSRLGVLTLRPSESNSPVGLLGDGGVGNGPGVVGGVDSSQIELRSGGSEVEREDGRNLALRDEGLKEWGRAGLGEGLEAHSSDANGGEEKGNMERRRSQRGGRWVREEHVE